MTQFALSQNTQNLINLALLPASQGGSAGSNNINYYNAYSAICADLVAHGGVDPATLYWFSQAGNVNRNAFTQSGAGDFIWAFTKGAAASEGVALTQADLQGASDAIAFKVFQQLKANPVFDDSVAFSPKNIIAIDAGTGINFLKTLYPTLDNAIWGGSLFARTALADSTYFSDYGIDLTPGSRSANALLSGWASGMIAVGFADAGAFAGALQSFFGGATFDLSAIAQAESSDVSVALTVPYLSNGTMSPSESQAVLNILHKLYHGISSLYEGGNSAVLIQNFAMETAGLIFSKLASGLSGFFGGLTGSTTSFWDSKFSFQQTPGSPIILDLTGDGVSTVSENAGTYFDLRNTGFAEKTGWVAPTDGLLVWDRNGNGVIDSGAELFGNYTKKADGTTTAANGFDALTSFDTNADGKINASDALWNNLKIWVDSNGNGTADAGELRTLASLNIQSLNLANTNAGVNPHDAAGNNPQYVGTYTKTDNSTAAMTDVNFANDTSQTVATNWVATTTAIDALPDIQGMGTLYSLHEAMARDTIGTLQSLVTQFTAATDTATRNTVMEQLLINWAGAQNVNPTSRNSNGGNVNAQHLVILEAAEGRAYGAGFQLPNPADPYPQGAAQLNQSYNFFFERMYAQLAAQTFLKPFYDEVTTVTDSTGTHFNFTAALADLFGNTRSASVQQTLVLEFYRTVYASGLLDAQVNYAGLMSALSTSAPQYVTAVNQIIAPYVGYNLMPSGGSPGLYDLNPSSDGATIVGGLGGATIDAYTGPSNIGVYNVTVYGNAGNNTINAAPLGAYKIYGGTGNDTVTDRGTLAAGTIIDGGAGTNLLNLDYGVGVDITRAAISNFQTLILNTTSTAMTRAQFGSFANMTGTAGGFGGEIDVADAGTYDLHTINTTGHINLSASGTTANITLIGNDTNDQVLTGGSGVGAIIGGNGANNIYNGGTGTTSITAGNGAGDILYAASASTILNGGSGGDTLNGYASSTVAGKIYGGAGNDTIVDYGTLAAGTIIDGGTGVNTLNLNIGVSADISQATISNIQNLTLNALGTTMTAQQYNAFTNISGTGTETILGAAGANVYKFGAAFGQDIVKNFNGGNTTAQGEVDFTASTTTNQNLWFTQSGSDLIVRALGTNNTITMSGWFGANAGAKVQTFNTATGLTLSNTAVAQLVTAMATYQAAHTTFNAAAAGAVMPADTVLQSAITTAWVANPNGVSIAVAMANQAALDAAVGGYKIVDTAANVVTGMTFLLSDVTHIASILLTDAATPTLALTSAQYTADATILSKISNAYNLTVSAVSAATASTVAGNAHVTSMTVSDTAANVQANIAALQTLAIGTKLSSIVLTDGTTPTLALTGTQYIADTAALGKITSAYNLSVTAVTAANATAVAGNTHVTSMTVSDTGANVQTNIAALQTLAIGTKLSSIVLTDGTTPTLTLTGTQYAADTNALGKITSVYNLSVTAVTAANATAVAGNTHVTSMTVSDTAANVQTNIAALQALAIGTKLSSIVLTDGATPTLTLTGTQYAADTNALGKITSAYNLSVTAVTAANATAVAGNTHVTSMTVSDTGANVLTNIAALQTLAIGTKLSSIALTDGTTPTLALTYTQYTADTAALGKISSAYNLTVSGVAAANAATVAGNTHVTSMTISDTAANFVASLASMETLSASGKITAIAFTDSTTPTITLTAAQQTADIDALNKITSAYNLVITGGTVTAAVAATATSAVAVSDTAANVLTYLSQLQTQAVAGRINSIVFTDSTTPTLPLTAAQYSADTTVLSKISSAYNLSISAVLAVNAATIAAAAHVTSISVSDTAANVVASIASLQTLAIGTKLASIALTDGTTPTLALTAAQYAADMAALGKISSAYNLAVSAVLAVNAATVSAAAHVTSVAVTDTAANVLTSIAALQSVAAANELTSIALTDGTTPTLALTAAQYTADATALGKISSAYNLTVSGVSAANAASVAGNTHVTSMTVSDTGVNTVANIAALQTLATGTKLASITLTDGTTPTLALTSAQYTADTAALGKITSAYNLSVSGVLSANAATVAAAAHVTSVAVSDTGANVVANIAALQTLATSSELSSIVLTDATTPTLALTTTQYSADTLALSKISSAYNVSVVLGGVTFVFPSTAVSALSSTASSVDFTVNSAATGYTEHVTWTTGGKALLTLTNPSNQSFASSLGWLVSGQTVNMTGANVSVFNASAQKINATQVNTDGSQADINYNVGTGTWATNTYYYNAAGVQTQIAWTNTDGSSSATFYNPALAGALAVTQNIAANGTGTISTVNSQTISFAAGNVPTVSYGATNNNIVTFTTGSGTGPVDVVEMSATTISATSGTNKVVTSLTGTSVALDAAGVITLTAPATGFGNDTLTVNANGNDRFALLADSLTFAGKSLQSISFSNGAFNYSLVSSAAGETETIVWNPTTGKAVLNLTNASNVTVASSLGYIDPNCVVAVNGALITNTNAAGLVQNSTLINADGSQVDTNFDTGANAWKDSVYYYNAAGIQTEVRYDNDNGTYVDNFYNAAGTVIGQTINNGDGILHSINTNISAENTSTMTTLDVNGSTSLTAAELTGFTTLTNSTGSADTIFATTAGSYSIASKTITGNFNLSAANTTANVTLIGNNQAGQVLTGGAGTDTLVVGTGNDTLNGGTGYTAYSFGTVFGQDTINNAYAGNTVAKGEIDFATGINNEKLWFQKSGSDLLIDLLGTTDQVKVAGWYGANAGADVQTINAGGLKLDTQVAQLVNAMATYGTANPAFNPVTAGTMPTDTTLQSAIAAAWHA